MEMPEGLLAAQRNVESSLALDQLRGVVQETLAQFGSIRRVLVIHPDYSRTDVCDRLFPLIYEALKGAGLQRLDTLNAAGTHRSMTVGEKLAKLGMADRGAFGLVADMLDHSVEVGNLVEVGRIEGEFMREKTLGRWSEAIPVRVNRRLKSDYDLIIALSGTVPHESAGYAGGLKTFFPGVAGREVIDGLHWAAVLMGIPRLIGRAENPGRDVINEGARHIFNAIDVPIVSFNMVCQEDGHLAQPRGLFSGVGFGGFIAAYQAAVEVSSQLHIVRVDRPLDLVVQALGDGYDEVWTAGKGSYKLQTPGTMSAGGEIVLYQPQITCFHSAPDMDAAIREVGYHGLDYVLHFLESRAGFSRNVAAHVINVRGGAEYDRGAGTERNHAFEVSLATAIPEAVCRSVGLGYRNPATLRQEFEAASGNKLWVRNGGKMLYSRR